jgi:hypothetical protein
MQQVPILFASSSNNDLNIAGMRKDWEIILRNVG